MLQMQKRLVQGGKSAKIPRLRGGKGIHAEDEARAVGPVWLASKQNQRSVIAASVDKPLEYQFDGAGFWYVNAATEYLLELATTYLSAASP